MEKNQADILLPSLKNKHMNPNLLMTLILPIFFVSAGNLLQRQEIE